MNKRGWLVPILIVTINALVIIWRWNSLSEILPAHFDLQGNASGRMSRNLLLLYPLIGAAISLIAYVIAQKKQCLQTGLIILTSGFCLVLLSSTLVTLTSGTTPIFMLAEPVILLIAVVGSIISVFKSRNR